MIRLAPYLAYLESLLADLTKSSAPSSQLRTRIAAALGDEPASELRARASINLRRRSGAFFTSSYLAGELITETPSLLARWVSFDPTCGAGDLLLRVARKLPLQADLGATLTTWNQHLRGRDVNPDFVAICHHRLALLAASRGAVYSNLKNLAKILTNIRAGDALEESLAYRGLDLILLNPPYGQQRCPRDSEWATGNVTAASLFLEKAILASDAGTRIKAILPEVLRTGSRYRNWRQQIGSHAYVRNIQSIGLFDAFTDIDVFFITCDACPAGLSVGTWTAIRKSKSLCVHNLFDVCVGPLVPYRTPNMGPWFPYLHARTAIPWGEMGTPSQRKRFSGRVFRPPFIAIRRTSRPGDRHRAVATLVTGDTPIAVENHIIVCTPRRRSKSLCVKLLQLLKQRKVSTWIDSQIRCRHLTVDVIRRVPISQAFGGEYHFQNKAA